MEIFSTMMLAFVVFLLVALIVALGQAGTRRRRGVRLTLDQKSGEYIWVAADGRQRSLAEQQNLLRPRDD